jgi:D-alanyl-D-alanine dipeptidase
MRDFSASAATHAAAATRSRRSGFPARAVRGIKVCDAPAHRPPTAKDRTVMPTPALLTPIVTGPRLAIRPGLAEASRRLRADVHDRLQRAAAALPADHALLVLDALRTQAQQFASWNRRYAALARAHPDLDSVALAELCRRDVADPVNKPSGHQSGAAVDVTLLRDGTELDMGSAYGDFATRGTAVDRVRTDCPALTQAQRANRDFLARVMGMAGFVNYPEEWWHFSHGDRLWAQISRYGHDDGTRADQQVAREAYTHVAVIDSPLFEAGHAG